MKIFLMLWIVTGGGQVSPPAEVVGFGSMAECLVAAESLTEPNPHTRTFRYAVVARCVEVEG